MTAAMPLSDATVHALIEARVHDPFAVLGMHRDDGAIAVRALVRGATAVAVVPRAGGAETALTCRDPAGLFEGAIPGAAELFAYELVVRHADGSWHRRRDPYSFWVQLSDFDLGLLRAGHHHHLGDVLGAHPVTVDGVAGVRFAVWAPNAERVAVVGDWNGFEGRWHGMRPRPPYGVWELFIPGLAAGERYKYEIRGPGGALRVKADPCAQDCEQPPATASVVPRADDHAWGDGEWMRARSRRDLLASPMAIYECHLGSWARGAEPDCWPDYDELAGRLIAHCRRFGFTHLELLPLAAHPFEGSWGYQVTGQYAPNSRHGDAAGLRRFVDCCHQAGIGVIIDFVPGHFPKDDFALAHFDGSPCYEYADPREGEHKGWGTLVFNFRRPEVRNFLIAAALHWCRSFHIDGLRVDAVSSMLYRDYDRHDGQWVANERGDHVNQEAVSFLQELTATVRDTAHGVVLIAEESTAWVGVTAPTSEGGLGFHLKWNMGWMHDTLRYLAQDPIMRPGVHDWITFHQWYAYDERWVLPLSHDEVVHGKRSLIDKPVGDWWQRLAQVRLLYGWQVAIPGRPLLFQGAEFAQGREWSWERALDWNEAVEPERAALGRFLAAALALYVSEPALHMRDDHRDGFQWVDCENRAESVLAFLRHAPRAPAILVACNFTPVPRPGYCLGVPQVGEWTVLLDSDDRRWGGSGVVNAPTIAAAPEPRGIFPGTLRLILPPLAIVLLRGPDND